MGDAGEDGDYKEHAPRESDGSPNGSPRMRRGSGSITSRDGAGSPQGSPRQRSPRESLNSSPQPMRSPRSSPPSSFKQMMAQGLYKSEENDGELYDFSKHHSPGIKKEGELLSSRSSLAGSPPVGLSGLTGPRGESPLDLSAPRKRALEDPEGAQGKMPHIDLAKHLGFPMGFPLPPQLAYLALRPDLAALAPEFARSWNGHLKKSFDETSTKLPPSPIGLGAAGPTPSEASMALERMSELSKLGSADTTQGSMNLLHGGMGGVAPNRATAWQSHWLSKGQDATKDVLKCVWCKSSFASLAELTKHMKETKHCGVNLPPPMSQMPISPRLPPHMNSMRPPSHIRPPPPNSSSSNDYHGNTSSRDSIAPSIKENMPLPRKLVRGQDVWLGKGAEQTRQILKCMWCGQSFTSLQEMTSHMQKTQHYTNIVSQEQIISWKSPEDKANSQQHVNAVLTCKVCDMAFSSLKELSDHMVKNAHYKEHIMRSISESGARRRQTRDKRKKSLPVRKLLELERAHQDLPGYPQHMGQPGKESPGTGRITCDKCEEKIEAVYFVEHIRNCVGTPRPDMVKPSMLSPDSDYNRKLDSPSEMDSISEGKKTPEKGCNSPREKSDKPGLLSNETDKKDSLSALGSLEKLIEKSFDSRRNKVTQGGPLGSSILRRLGIDESADYSKPIMDPQLQNMYSAFSRLHSGMPGGMPGGPSTPSTLNLPPSFGPDERVYGMRAMGGMVSPGIESDTSDTFQRSPSRPGSRPASTGSSNRDFSSNDHPNLIENPMMPKFVPIRLPEKKPESQSNGILENGMDHSENEDDPASINDMDQPLNSPMDSDPIKPEPLEDDNMPLQESSDLKENGVPKEEIRVKEEFKVKDEREEDDDKMETGSLKDRQSPMNRLMGSPSSRSGTPHSDTSTGRGGPLAALGGLAAGASGNGGNGGNANPLAALQMFCDKTETTPRQKQASSSQAPQSNTGSILAFSWACNDAVGPDSIIKCAFCDTPFISKGAYRHHLSKMHFVKDGEIPEPGQGNNKNVQKMNKPQSSQGISKSGTPPMSQEEETPHSRFFKYTEMAKELSSK
ncbi:unnamed protein product, partial [Meganyctiphanes norvegica]